jgi:disulfide bond formation protein DsbB
MNSSRFINIVLILTGGLIALYAQAEDNQNVYILIGGIVMLMTGLYRLSRGISSKRTDESNEPVDNQKD